MESGYHSAQNTQSRGPHGPKMSVACARRLSGAEHSNPLKCAFGAGWSRPSWTIATFKSVCGPKNFFRMSPKSGFVRCGCRSSAPGPKKKLFVFPRLRRTCTTGWPKRFNFQRKILWLRCLPEVAGAIPGTCYNAFYSSIVRQQLLYTRSMFVLLALLLALQSQQAVKLKRFEILRVDPAGMNRLPPSLRALFADPVPDAEPVASLNEAAMRAGFTPRLPKSATPVQLGVTDPVHAKRQNRA